MIIQKITPSVDYNQWLKHLDTQLEEPTNQNSIKVPKFQQQIRKCYYKTLGTSIINNPMSPPFLFFNRSKAFLHSVSPCVHR